MNHVLSSGESGGGFLSLRTPGVHWSDLLRSQEFARPADICGSLRIPADPRGSLTSRIKKLFPNGKLIKGKHLSNIRGSVTWANRLFRCSDPFFWSDNPLLSEAIRPDSHHSPRSGFVWSLLDSGHPVLGVVDQPPCGRYCYDQPVINKC